MPFLGRVHDVDPNAPWFKITEFCSDFNGMFQTRMVGEDHLWISDPKIAYDLISKRANIYSSRPEIRAVPGSDRQAQYLPLLAHGDAWRRQRKFATIMLTASHNSKYHGYVEFETKRLLFKLLTEPENYFKFNDQYCGRVTAWLNYGRPDSADELCRNAREFIPQVGPSGSIINILPFLRHVPIAINPAKWPVRRRREREERVFLNAMEQAEADFRSGVAFPTNHAHAYLQRKYSSDSSARKRDELPGTAYGFAPDDREIAYTIGMLATVAIFTIGAPLNGFYLAMVLHPEWQEKVRQEIDSVLGTRKMIATREDYPQLPLLRACIKEVMRWRPVVPLGVPRKIEEDNEYNGHWIRKGTVAHVVELAVTRDPEVYPDPETFNPGRWLDPSYPTFKSPLTEHPNLYGFHGFGSGRRICPGIALTEAELLGACSGLLSAFVLEKKVRADGTVVDIDSWNMSPNLIGGALEFEFTLRSRGGEKEDRVRSMWYEAGSAHALHAS